MMKWGDRLLLLPLGPGFVHLTQTTTHHVLYFLFEASGTKLCSAGDLQVPHKITFEAELSLSVYQHKILSICLGTMRFPCCAFSVTENSTSSYQSDVIKSTSCDADTLHHWATEKWHQKMSKFILKVIWMLQEKCRGALLAKEMREGSFGDHKTTLSWLNQTGFI